MPDKNRNLPPNFSQNKSSMRPDATALPEEVRAFRAATNQFVERLLHAFEQDKPLSKPEKMAYEDFKRLHRADEQSRRGEISLEGMDSIIQDTRQRYPLCPPPPSWFPEELAELMVWWVNMVQIKNSSARKQFLRWIHRALAEPKGRPAKDNINKIHKQAARMRNTLGRNRRPPSWATITRKLCPHRNEHGHKCTKTCQDPIRLGANRYM